MNKANLHHFEILEPGLPRQVLGEKRTAQYENARTIIMRGGDAPAAPNETNSPLQRANNHRWTNQAR